MRGAIHKARTERCTHRHGGCGVHKPPARMHASMPAARAPPTCARASVLVGGSRGPSRVFVAAAVSSWWARAQPCAARARRQTAHASPCGSQRAAPLRAPRCTAVAAFARACARVCCARCCRHCRRHAPVLVSHRIPPGCSLLMFVARWDLLCEKQGCEYKAKQTRCFAWRMLCAWRIAVLCARAMCSVLCAAAGSSALRAPGRATYMWQYDECFDRLCCLLYAPAACVIAAAGAQALADDLTVVTAGRSFPAAAGQRERRVALASRCLYYRALVQWPLCPVAPL